MARFQELCALANRLGYKPENIHVVWVINDYQVALNQNATRDRVVDPKLAMDKHIGVSNTMAHLYHNLSAYQHLMNGDLWFVFNKAGVDSQMSGTKKAGYVSKASYIKVKAAGSVSTKQLDTESLAKLKLYTPSGWGK
jgi:hypothetical protein